MFRQITNRNSSRYRRHYRHLCINDANNNRTFVSRGNAKRLNPRHHRQAIEQHAVDSRGAIEVRRYPDRRWPRSGEKVERERDEEEKGREIGMLVSESHPLTPVFRRIVQSITPPSLSHHHLWGGPKQH